MGFLEKDLLWRHRGKQAGSIAWFTARRLARYLSAREWLQAGQVDEDERKDEEEEAQTLQRRAAEALELSDFAVDAIAEPTAGTGAASELQVTPVSSAVQRSLQQPRSLVITGLGFYNGCKTDCSA